MGTEHRKKRIGILLPNWIGDVVMATPTLRAIRKHFGARAELLGIMKPYVAEVLVGTSWLDNCLLYDRRSQNPQLRTLPLLRRLRQWQPDVMVLLTNSFWAGGLAWLSGARERVGYCRNGRGPLLTKRKYAPRSGGKWQPISAIDYYLELAYSLGCPAASPRMELGTLPADESGASQVWRNLALDQVERVVVFNAGSATGSARHWPGSYYVELAKCIVADPTNAVLVICGPRERELAATIEREAAHRRVRSMADQDLSLGVAKACVRRSQLMVTTDSGPRHFAPAFNVPVITMFGPIDPRWSDSHHPRAMNLQHPVDCGPCGLSVCPLAHQACMRDLTVDRVYAAVLAQFDLSRRQAAA